MIKDIHTALLGNITNEKSEGLISKVNKHEKKFKTFDKLIWILITILLMAIAGNI